MNYLIINPSRCLLMTIIFLAISFCLSPVGSSLAQERKDKKKSVVITSEAVTVNNKAKTAIFERSVSARKGDMTLFADRMKVFYAEKKDGGGVRKIEADGNVRLIKGGGAVTSKSATYTAADERIVFRGDPVASDGENVITGFSIAYFLKDDRSIVEKGRVFMKDK
ncbi:MAG: LptA/OstA family protein [Nitrospirae bacterium]|nr:LptA/OstA family protein [Nitrospirota bacterium]